MMVRALLAIFVPILSASALVERDLVVYGSSPAAIAAAVQAKRMGKTVVVVSPETRIGGLTTGGLGQTDIGNKSAFGGIALEFYRDVACYYRDEANWKWQLRKEYLPDGQCSGTKGEDSMWTFEPSAALKILEGWEKKYGLDIRRGEYLDRESKSGVEVKGGWIKSIKTLSGNEYRGKMFVDATYEGDLMAAAGVSYFVGREANAVYDETISGNAPDADGAWNHNLNDGVSAYVKPGDRSSGLLPGVESYNPTEKPGDGDKRVQAYCFRMCLTDVPENRIPFVKPANYDEKDYELLFRDYEAAWARPGQSPIGARVWTGEWIPSIMSRMPNRKTDSNNRCGVSTDFIGRNWRWPEATYEEREQILNAHRDYQMGLMWTLANHPRIPEKVRAYFAKFGTCKDEFHDGLGNGWQRQLYVREARRMVGDYVMTEHNCRGKVIAPRPVAMGAYTMDSHHVRRIETKDGFVRNEGNVEDGCFPGPYGIDYGAIIPKRVDCANLFVPVCISASHVAFGSIRMEPVFFALGQVAGTAAAQAIDAECSVQDLPYSPLAARLLHDGQVLADLESYVPYKFRMGNAAGAAADLRDVRQRTGLRRFLLTGPGFNEVMYAPFADDLYAKMGAEMAEVKRRLSDTDIELGWWCAPSIRYVSNHASIEDAWGNKSVDNKKCPLDPAFQSDWAAKVKSVVAAFRPAVVNIEDDYTLAWGRGLKGGACYCPRHLAAFAARYGKALTGPEIAAAFENRTKENEPIRRAFAETVRDSLAELAGKVRAAVDEVDPSIRIMLCESGACSDRDGDAIETLARAFAGSRTRPCVRPSGAIYGAQTTPADIPPAVSHTMYTLERLPRDVETFYEADPYPHNRFFTSAAQMQSLMSGAVFMGAQSILFYCLQYLDDPLEDPGYADSYRTMKPRLEAVRSFVASRQSRLAGVRVLWRSEDSYLTQGKGGGHGGQLDDGAFLCAKMGLPYTTRADAEGPVLMAGNVAETMSDEEIRKVLSGGVLLDAPAAALLRRRGFGAQLGADVELADGRLPVIGERLLPAAGLACKGRAVNAFYILSAGTEGTVETFATLRPKVGTEVWSEFTGVGGRLVTPSITFATNALGGRVAVLATSLLGNRSSGLYNLRKQELIRNLFNRLSPEALPVAAVDAPGIWTLAQVSSDGREMLVMVDNLSGDKRRGLSLVFADGWCGAKVSRLDETGLLRPLGNVNKKWAVPFCLEQMEPEFLMIARGF